MNAPLLAAVVIALGLITTLALPATTFTPASIIFCSSAGSLDEGPRVATILVARRAMAVSL